MQINQIIWKEKYGTNWLPETAVVKMARLILLFSSSWPLNEPEQTEILVLHQQQLQFKGRGNCYRRFLNFGIARGRSGPSQDYLMELILCTGQPKMTMDPQKWNTHLPNNFFPKSLKFRGKYLGKYQARGRCTNCRELCVCRGWCLRHLVAVPWKLPFVGQIPEKKWFTKFTM